MVKMVKTDVEYKKALEEVEKLIDLDPPANTIKNDRLELLSFIVAKYEEDNYPLGFPDPIEAIKFRMEQKRLTQRDLIPFIGSRSKVSEVLNRKRPLTLKMMRAINKNLGIPAEVLLQEQGGALLSAHNEIDWLRFPLKEMLKRQWFTDFNYSLYDVNDYAEELMRKFLKGVEIEDLEQALCRQNIRSGSEMDQYALLAWKARVQYLAEKNHIRYSYNPGIVNRGFLSELVKLSYLSDGPLLAKEFLAKNGIQIIILRHLPKTHLDGAALTVKETTIIALTLRHNRLDNFWFSLFHELSHIALHIGKDENDCFLDDLDVNGNELEEQADQFARDALIPVRQWERFPQKFTTQTVLSFAESLRIHPSIVAGRVRREQNNYRILSRLVGSGESRKYFPEYYSN